MYGLSLISDSCSSPRSFGLEGRNTPPRDDALALLLAFGSANTWPQDFHLQSNVPCTAHRESEPTPQAVGLDWSVKFFKVPCSDVLPCAFASQRLSLSSGQ